MFAHLSRHQNAQHKHTRYTPAARSESVLCRGEGENEREKRGRDKEHVAGTNGSYQQMGLE